MLRRLVLLIYYPFVLVKTCHKLEASLPDRPLTDSESHQESKDGVAHHGQGRLQHVRKKAENRTN
jgi:hypothetical protein